MPKIKNLQWRPMQKPSRSPERMKPNQPERRDLDVRGLVALRGHAWRNGYLIFIRRPNDPAFDSPKAEGKHFGITSKGRGPKESCEHFVSSVKEAEEKLDWLLERRGSAVTNA